MLKASPMRVSKWVSYKDEPVPYLFFSIGGTWRGKVGSIKIVKVV